MTRRVKQCVHSLRESGYDAILVSDPVNVASLSGYRGADGYCLVTADGELTYFTNFLYKEAAQSVSGWNVLVPGHGTFFTLVAGEIKRRRLRRIGFEAKILPYLEYSALRKVCAGRNIQFEPTVDFIEKLRMVKSPAELDNIRRSAAISRDAFDYAREIVSSTMTEKMLSVELERYLCLRADRELAFPSIVAAGANSSRPHHLPGDDGIFKKNVLIDLGSKYCGYCADLTRVFFWGKMPKFFKRIHDIVQKAQELGIRKIYDGAKASEVDRAARDYITGKGFGKYFGHGLGHGVGLAVHELPRLSPKSSDILREGMVVTVEPAIYLAGKFGVRIEDMVVVGMRKGEVIGGNSHR